jgi:hypothetical protein
MIKAARTKGSAVQPARRKSISKQLLHHKTSKSGLRTAAEHPSNMSPLYTCRWEVLWINRKELNAMSIQFIT